LGILLRLPGGEKVTRYVKKITRKMNQKIAKKLRQYYRKDVRKFARINADMLSKILKPRPWYFPKFLWKGLIKIFIRF
jgi:hypothetical protein